MRTRAGADRSVSAPARPAFGIARAGTPILAAAMFLVVLGGKLITFEHFGFDLPHWDQWDGEGDTLFLPYLQERLQWTDFLRPHNEHRMAPSKLLSLALLCANGQWDNRLESVVNAGLHAVLAVAIFLFGRGCIEGRTTPLWFAGVAALIASPVAWQNVLSGFQSAQILILMFAAGASVCLFRFRPGHAGWWSGLALAWVSVVTIGSGLFVPGAIAGLLALSDSPRAVVRRHGVTIGACLLAFAIGCWSRVEAPHHEALKAATAGEFCWTVWRSLQWPVTGFVLFPLLAWAPWTWLTWQIVVRRRWRDPQAWALSAAGAFVLLNYAAAGYARGAGGGWPASRYCDTVAFGIIVNLLTCLLVFTRVRLSGWRHGCRLGLSIVGIVFLAHGLWREVAGSVRHVLPGVAARMQEREAKTRMYILSGDRRDLENGPIPYPHASVLADRLSHPEIRAILPVSVRAPAELRGSSDPDNAFARGRMPAATAARHREIAWFSFSDAPAGKQGVWSSELLPPAAGGFWQFRVTGSLDSPAVSFAVTDRDHHLVAALPARSGWRDDWTILNVRAPSEPSRVLARDAGPNEWIAFSGPRFMASGSYWTWRLVAASEYVLMTGLIAAWVGLLVDGLFQWRARRERHVS